MKTGKLIFIPLTLLFLSACTSKEKDNAPDTYTDITASATPSPDNSELTELTATQPDEDPPADSASATPKPTPGQEEHMMMLKACASRGALMPDALTLPNGVEMDQDFLIEALLSNGNTGRLRNVMLKASKGETITLAYLGGSITAGSNADPMESKCWASLTTDWWKNTFPDAKINYVNAGIGATDSYVGAHRLKQDVLDYKPDIVVVEFSVNDTMDLNTETYESILRALLADDSAPAVVPLLLCTAGGDTFAPEHQPLAVYYDLPVIACYNLLETGKLTWEQVGDTDGIHPKNEGHAVIAGVMCSFYRLILEELYEDAEERGIGVVSIESAQERAGSAMPEKRSHCCYTDASFIYADSPEAVQFKTNGFVPLDEDKNILHGKGWKTDSAGTFTFETDARAIGLAISVCDDPNGSDSVRYEVYIDGELYTDFDNSLENRGNGQLRYISVMSDEKLSHHKVDLVPADNNSGKNLTIYGWAIGK